jgi:hypothetical protein
MKQDDEIEQLRVKEFNRLSQEDVIIDMCLGLFLILFWLGFHLHNPILFFVFIIFVPLIVRRLKRKLVYPRVGRAVFGNIRKQNPFLKNGLYLMLVIMGLSASILFYNSQLRHGVVHPLYIPFWITISGLLILGSVTQKHMFYAVALCLVLPIISSELTKLFWFGMPMEIVWNVSVLMIIVWLIDYKKPIISRAIAPRPNLVIRVGFLILGLLSLAYFVLLVYYPVLTIGIKQWIYHNPGVTFGCVFALGILGIGIAFNEIRFYLYAILVSATGFLSKVMMKDFDFDLAALAGIGGIIIVVGILLFRGFLKRYPILQEPEDVPEAI